MQGLERGSELRRHIATGGSDDARRISTDKITAQLRDISVYVLVWLHNQQLRQSPRTTEESIRETERRTFEKDRNDSLGLSIELSSDDKKFIQLLQDKNWSEIVMLKEGGYKPSKDVMSAFDTNGLSRTEKLILDVVCGSVETNNRGLVKNYMDKNSSLINKGTVDLNMG